MCYKRSKLFCVMRSIFGEITLYSSNYPPICTFTSKVSNVTHHPSKLSNCDNLTTLTLFFLFKMPPSHILFYFIKKKKKYAGVVRPPQTAGLGVAEPPPGQTGWPATPYGVVRPPQHISFFYYYYFFFVIGAFWKKKKKKKKKRAKVVELPQFECLGGGVKCHI
jgi:hypothetical protein